MSFRLQTIHRQAPTSLLLAALFVCAGCHQDMKNQPRYEPLEESSFFPNDMSSRPLVAGTVARGQLNEDIVFQTGKDESGNFVAEVPLPLSRELLERGQSRFNIYCTPCHARTGNGDGMVVQRGFKRPPSYHIERLVNAPSGHFFDVMTKGFGVMPSFAVQLDPRDRWAIVAYIRVLQLSQNATLEDVPPSERVQLEQMPATREPMSQDSQSEVPAAAEEGHQ
jgi:mono/diheme cytochrome c family protein